MICWMSDVFSCQTLCILLVFNNVGHFVAFFSKTGQLKLSQALNVFKSRQTKCPMTLFASNMRDHFTPLTSYAIALTSCKASCYVWDLSDCLLFCRKRHCLLAYLFTYLQLLTYLLININSRLHSVIINYTFCKLHCSAPSITISLHVVAGWIFDCWCRTILMSSLFEKENI